jgi:hypothetical protein
MLEPRHRQRRRQDRQHRERRQRAGHRAAPEVQQRRHREAQAERELCRGAVERQDRCRHGEAGHNAKYRPAATDQGRAHRQPEEGDPDGNLVEARRPECADRNVPAEPALARQVEQGKGDGNRGSGGEEERQPARRRHTVRGRDESQRRNEEAGETRVENQAAPRVDRPSR